MVKESEKIPLSTVKKFPYKTLNRMITKAKKYIEKDKVWIDVCKKYEVEPSIINLIPIKFGDLDVSATTDHGIITLNYKLLCDGDFFKDFAYLIHEGNHFLQQCFNDKPTKNSDDGEYLENKYEQEAFSNQVGYIAEQFGEKEAEDYVDNLLEYHDVDNKDYDKLEDVLMGKV